MGRGEIVIQRPVEEVFDVVADEANPYDPRIVRAEKLTPGPIGLHTRFRSEARGLFGIVSMIVEVTGYDRPRSLESRTHLSGMDVEAALRFEPCDGGTRLAWSSSTRPRGLLRLVKPLLELASRRQERRIWTALKNAMERESAGFPP